MIGALVVLCALAAEPKRPPQSGVYALTWSDGRAARITSAAQVDSLRREVADLRALILALLAHQTTFLSDQPDSVRILRGGVWRTLPFDSLQADSLCRGEGCAGKRTP